MPAVRENTAHRRNERCSTLFGRNVPKLFKKLSVVFIVIAVLSGISCRIYARFAAERVHGQSRIVCYTRHTALTAARIRL